ncbi:unnamed protein product [Sphagnum troendelagicum]|uniref:HTH myb-type domain-containing protein n=1 Tax=Sphagnum troendelagicum TaxID=128251 RepID=A0ABP0UYZ8_9BRYO
MACPPDLSLGCQTQAPSSASTITSSEVSNPLVNNQLGRIQALEDEQRKIEAFKRELPLCMQLLEEAIAKSKEQLEEMQPAPGTPQQPLQLRCSTPEKSQSNVSSPNDNSKLVLKEFMPLKKRRLERLQGGDQLLGGDEEGDRQVERTRGIDIGRPAWMAEAQLWTQHAAIAEARNEANGSIETSRLLLSSKQRPTGAFLPFTRKKQLTPPAVVSQSNPVTSNGANLSLSSVQQLPGLEGQAFLVAESEVGGIDAGLSTQEVNAEGCMKRPLLKVVSGAGSICSEGGSQSQRKARRCWSPELHQRFVRALQQLGGSQVATPKQIRELMKVDGLTNDEVKSHLQKYRLHTQRPSPPPQSASAHAPQLVVLGTIWGPDPDYVAAAAAAAKTAAAGAPLQVTNPVSSGVGYQYDSGGEEGKSDSTSWKGRPLETGSGDREEESQIQIKPQAAAAAAAAEQL